MTQFKATGGEDMSCCDKSCFRCNRLVTSTSIVISGGKVIINVPTPSPIVNNKQYCLVIAQSLPTGSGTLPVSLCWANGTVVPVNSKNGNYLRADQITCRRKYRIVYGNDPVHYSLVHDIKCSGYTVPAIVIE